MAKRGASPRILVLHGPNLNMLGKRDNSIYGTLTLEEIDAKIMARASDLGVEAAIFQSNSEGALVDLIQTEAANCRGIVINPGALTHYGLSLRDALQDAGLPIIEVHLSNIHARETWRATSVVAPIAKGQIVGLGWQGYLSALDTLASLE